MRRTPDRRTTFLNALVAALLGVAVLVAIGTGLGALGVAQTGRLGAAPPPDPGVLVQPELAPDAVTVHECVDARGEKLYSSAPCASADGTAPAERAVAVTTLDLAPAKP